jgi:hypothetical protein
MKLITMVHMENNQSKQQLQQDHIHMDYDDAMDFHSLMNSYLHLIPFLNKIFIKEKKIFLFYFNCIRWIKTGYP